jgi:folate-binding protein YgfZ
MHRTTACPLMPLVVLPEVHCIAIEGPDARRFAQAQFSGDVESLAQGRWQWNAWLDARGRVQALMQLGRVGEDRYLAILRGGDAERLRADLGRYLLRSKARVTARVFSGIAGDAVPAGQVDADAQGEIVFGYGNRSLRLESFGRHADAEASNAWRLADIRAGWPTLPAGDELFLPPALGLERLDAVSFDKGCYPGQEIVARLHYRGGHKFGLCQLRGPNWLEPGGTFDAGDTDPVRVLDCAIADGSVEALAVISKSQSSTISILDHKFDVVSRYNA